MKLGMLVIALSLQSLCVSAAESWRDRVENTTNAMVRARGELLGLAALLDKCITGSNDTFSIQALEIVEGTHTNLPWRELRSHDSMLQKRSVEAIRNATSIIISTSKAHKQLMMSYMGVDLSSSSRPGVPVGGFAQQDSPAAMQTPTMNFTDERSRRNYIRAMSQLEEMRNAPAREAEGYAIEAERHSRAARQAALEASVGYGVDAVSSQDRARREAASAQAAANAAENVADNFNASQTIQNQTQDAAERARQSAERARRAVP